MKHDITGNEVKWAKKIWISYWVIIFTHFFAQLYSFLFLPYPASAGEFYTLILIVPTLAMGAVTAASYLCSRFWKHSLFYTLFSAGSVIAVTIIKLNADIRIISALFLLPILASVLFNRLALTLFSAALQFAGFFCLYVWDSNFRSYLTHFDVVAIPCFIAVGTLMAHFIMIRGQEMRDELRDAVNETQDLLAKNRLMDQQARTDALTGLGNHRSFHDRFDRTWSDGEPFCLALIDIDNFKAVNDTYGHQVGDLVLARSAGILKEKLRPADFAG